MKTEWSNSRQHSHEWASLTESSKEGYGSKRVVLPTTMMMMMMLMMIMNLIFVNGIALTLR
jgi:hypothetical protein